MHLFLYPRLSSLMPSSIIARKLFCVDPKFFGLGLNFLEMGQCFVFNQGGINDMAGSKRKKLAKPHYIRMSTSPNLYIVLVPKYRVQTIVIYEVERFLTIRLVIKWITQW